MRPAGFQDKADRDLLVVRIEVVEDGAVDEDADQDGWDRLAAVLPTSRVQTVPAAQVTVGSSPMPAAASTEFGRVETTRAARPQNTPTSRCTETGMRQAEVVRAPCRHRAVRSPGAPQRVGSRRLARSRAAIRSRLADQLAEARDGRQGLEVDEIGGAVGAESRRRKYHGSAASWRPGLARWRPGGGRRGERRWGARRRGGGGPPPWSPPGRGRGPRSSRSSPGGRARAGIRPRRRGPWRWASGTSGSGIVPRGFSLRPFSSRIVPRRTNRRTHRSIPPDPFRSRLMAKSMGQNTKPGGPQRGDLGSAGLRPVRVRYFVW